MAIGLAGLAAAALSSLCTAGEPIKFSEPSSKVTALVPDAPRPASKSFDFLKPDAPSAPNVDAPTTSRPNTPESPMNKRLKELLDKQRNWIFLRPEDWKQSSTADDLLNPDKTDRPGREGKNSQVLERFFSAPEPKKRSSNSQAPAPDPVFERGSQELRSTSPLRFGRETGKSLDNKSGFSWDRWFNQNESANPSGRNKDAPSGLFDSLDSNPSANLPNTRGSPEKTRAQQAQEARADSFKKLLERPTPQSVIAGEKDLINSAVDTTRQPLNPVLGASWEDYTRSVKGLDPLNPFPGNGPGARNSRSLFGDDLAARILGKGGYSSPVITPTPNLPTVAKPASFEFPARKF